MPDKPHNDQIQNSPLDTADEYSAEISLERFATDLYPADNRSLKNLALVLTARGIPCRLLPQKKPRLLLVKDHDLASAEREIALYLKENRKQPLEPERFTRQENNTLQTISALLLIGVFHNITYLDLSDFGHTSIDWLQLGRADANLIRTGEWWRTITALTLHADGQHLLSNLLIGGYFVIRLCKMLGGGLGWSLILWSGILGNAINALMHVSGHRSIGSSTALFGAIGIAGMIGLMRHRRLKSRYSVLPFAAAIGLLAMLGAGTGDVATDIGAHLFGFAAGLALGAVASHWILEHGLPSALTNRVLAITAILTPVCAWLIALIN